MEAKELHTISTSPVVSTPFSLEWSEDDRISLVTEKQLHITTNHRHSSSMFHKMLLALMMALTVVLPTCSSTDITSAVFGNVRDVLPAAFGDFDSDELTDMFVMRNDRQTLEIMLASDQEPFLRSNETLRCTFKKSKISGVVPGDFDGDALMDVLVTTTTIDSSKTRVYIMWGGMHHLNCSSEDKFLFEMNGEPLAIDYNGDMIIDLFGLDDRVRTFWIFHNNRTYTKQRLVGQNVYDLRAPHSHAFLDVNNDYAPDLVLTGKGGLEFWFAEGESFRFNQSLDYPIIKSQGQTLFLDVSMKGSEDILLPQCVDTYECHQSRIYIHSPGQQGWCNLQVDFTDNSGVTWGFIKAQNEPYTDAITLRGGDFNMDGYPDLLASLQQVSNSGQNIRKSLLLKNVPCTGSKQQDCCFNRTFEIQWNTLEPMNQNTNMAVFYDFGQDGTLDVLFVHKDTTGKYEVSVFKNSLDYDANFMKVMVLTGLTNSQTPPKTSSLSRKKVKTFGSNLPGPSISYRTQTQEGTKRIARSSQLPQSAYCPLGLPYSIFGLGRTPNFIDSLTVGLTGKSREWTQIIPNSQMLVIPVNPVDPSTWKAQLFVTPSKLVFMSVAALLATCVVITLIILGLYWKERRQDKRERLQEAHRFHFDAM